MRNIWFTIYTGSIEEYSGIANYRTLLEILLIPAIQDKINRDKKVQKIMLMFYSDLENDDIEYFKGLYYNKKPSTGIINISIAIKETDWNNLSERKRKDFLIEKWKVLFSNLSDDYFLIDKSEVIKSLDELKNKDWKVTTSPIKKKLKYNKEVYTVVIDLSTERAQLALVRDSDEKWIKLKDFETWKIMTDANFKNFKLDGDILAFSYSSVFNTLFTAPEIFNLKEIIN
ncbi:hypothetical protein [Chryseobacterium rhizosphaerae]|uniref:Uncharacterized protein n=1 Tax=Chryseobacterium rhizosphaerae TaxID=395937 RepID=A0ABX9IJB5_9FLAO|nr:hypothetical protein [Chryseobacterium rhizosphaerae]MDC8102432.1 hypothetical protein [Chryseobacterium rhizosphaerae]REC74160.1 hypothetical protein DRF57_15240 [Chryseobacterium rhizosphaerae]GEN69925.1 hypothetical protein CRH01_44930 [Chryseobacterium rhizosphaerae]